jgi:CubicO group peptidase (beta-lactamase class C family)
VAVVKDGQVVADVARGVADPRTGAAVSAGTLFYAASTAKGEAATVAHVLAERGELDYDMRAVDVWPEFGSHGKDKVTLRHVLLHTAGVPGLPRGLRRHRFRRRGGRDA